MKEFILFIFLATPLLIVNSNAETEQISEKLNSIDNRLNELNSQIDDANQHSEAIFWSTFFAGEILAGIAIVGTIWYGRKLIEQTNEMKKQSIHNKLAVSANLVFELDKRIFTEYDHQIQLIRQSQADDTLQLDLEDLERYLGELELISMLIHSSAIDTLHGYEMFSTIIEEALSNQQVFDFIQNVQLEDPELYSGLMWLNEHFNEFKEQRR